MITRKKYEQILISILESKFNIDINNIQIMKSREGIIVTNGIKVYKCLTFLNEQQELISNSLKKSIITEELSLLYSDFLQTNQLITHFYLNLKALSESIKKDRIITIVNFDVFCINNLIIIEMPYLNISDFKYIDKSSIINIIKDFKKICCLSLDFEPKNIKQFDNKLIFIDIGIFFVPFYEDGFKTMCRRAYITLHFFNSCNLKRYLRGAILDDELSFLPDSLLHKDQFNSFYKEINR